MSKTAYYFLSLIYYLLSFISYLPYRFGVWLSSLPGQLAGVLKVALLL